MKKKKTVTRLFFEDNENLQQSQNEVLAFLQSFRSDKIILMRSSL